MTSKNAELSPPEDELGVLFVNLTKANSTRRNPKEPSESAISAEKMLICAIIHRALKDLNCSDDLERNKAINWILYDADDEPFTPEWAFEILGLLHALVYLRTLVRYDIITLRKKLAEGLGDFDKKV